ncbi:MAG: DnaB-like helicase N-terminal domain-containing protein [Macellibacteroides fermentans]|uniref:DnaB-like helicase N-terminal domain-containing protein n=1 Tax=Macellibacteroides fermentans TaxID=879969 RepID=UPI003AD34055
MTESNTGITHEKAVVACLIANNETITYLIGFLKTYMFSSRKPGFIYKDITNLFEQVERSNYNLIDRTTQKITKKGYQVRLVNYDKGDYDTTNPSNFINNSSKVYQQIRKKRG